ncbi:MAG: non-homologous end-joining DNA ligase [Myxococcales bacterium]|nr:non-homologous end-joining DNA ligase [Myxococcales bacterium]
MSSAAYAQLATLVQEPPRGDDWIHEAKLDGYRIFAHIEDGRVKLCTRNGNDWTDRMAVVAENVAALGLSNTILDGEVCAVAADGRTDFQLLQNSLGSKKARIVYYVFDLLRLRGDDIRSRPLVERKQLLKKALGRRCTEAEAPVRYSEHVVGRGDALFAQACKLGLEGIISKRGSSPYTAGRGTDWLKIKCTGRQEFVVVGYTPPAGSREHFGALLVATRRGGQLQYAGKVGTGYTRKSLADIAKKLAPLRRTSPPVDVARFSIGLWGITWVEPELVAEIEYSEVTRDGLLRHPVFRGLREDKPAKQVAREVAKRVGRQAQPARPGRIAKKPAKRS